MLHRPRGGLSKVKGLDGGVDLVRKRSADSMRVDPLEPPVSMIDAFVRRGGNLWACTPCVKARGYTARLRPASEGGPHE
jgi:predicted peroxiredoxin